jgi:hypothetical protein
MSDVISERSRALTRLSTRVHPRALDRALAAGVSPDSSAALSMRARVLYDHPAADDLEPALQEALRALEFGFLEARR